MDVIREQLAKLRKEGKSPSIGDVTPYAKKEWADIKAGKHPLYMQGSSKGKGKGSSKGSSKGTSKGTGKGKGKKNKTQKIMKGSNMGSNAAIQQMLSKVHLCKKDVMKIQKYIKTQKGGGCGCAQTGGGCGCDQSGGAKRRTKKNKMKGGADADTDADANKKESYVDFPSKDGLEELDEDTDGTQLDVQQE